MPSSVFLLALLSPPAFVLLKTLQNFYKNYQIAKQTGLPIIVSPCHPWGILWLAVLFVFRPWIQHSRWGRVLEPTWSWHDNDSLYEELGSSAYVLVSPTGNVIFTNDAGAINQALTKRKEFYKGSVYESMNLFGRNVDTVNGEEWSRHRRITAPCFNERVSGFVWDESLRQSHSMLTHWLSSPAGLVSNMVEDTRVVALHVLSAAGFGISHDFHGGNRNVAPGHTLSHRDALMGILNNLIASIVLGNMKWLSLFKPVWPKQWHAVDVSMKEFAKYLDELVDAEREAMKSAQGVTKPNLISTLIRTSDEAKAESVNSAVRLTDEEIKGNLFIFNLAGHDTTANTLSYAFALLAVYPEVQEWIIEEIDDVFGKLEGKAEYEKAFPKLKRVLAVMYETLRLYGQVPKLPREYTPNTELLLSHPTPSGEPRNILLPPNTAIVLDVHSSQVSARHFTDSKMWNPKRWIKSSPSIPASASLAQVLDGETFQYAEQGYAPWAGGPRICPGMKFAHVEFTAVLSSVLRAARVGPAVKGGPEKQVSEAAARDEVMKCVRDSHDDNATLTIRRPEDLWLKVQKR
ncbi:cytochrome P450 [Corynespora cassiicola Philippines]|uniref:Cytochrome P450 n=1 Tax=Corynespora cassiicola Philippines TaxID=1448308 RepID=A0A2T2N7J9_CORCC|nr:cytochrome P450 [Corynespora cassiicola Philippines]